MLNRQAYGSSVLALYLSQAHTSTELRKLMPDTVVLFGRYARVDSRDCDGWTTVGGISLLAGSWYPLVCSTAPLQIDSLSESLSRRCPHS